jgi:hypothetical protein
MNRDHFQRLAEAYGGVIARWPDAMRDEASLFAATEPEFARRVLEDEMRLDSALDELPRAAASSRLFEAVVASAPALRPRRRWSFWAAPAGLGAALAASAVAGVLLGAQFGLDNARNAEASAQAVADLDVSAVSEVG